MNLSEMNASIILINTSRHMEHALMEQFSTNKKIKDPAFHVLIVMYAILIIVGAVGNTLVVISVIRKSTMRTARNMFILNLAISDLLLCLVTMPLTLMEVLTKYWPLGRYAFICKMIGTLQATSIFVSTISITAIALDRYQVIVYSTRDNLEFMGALGILTGIWMLALLLASPMFLFKRLFHIEIPKNLNIGIDNVAYCIEDWPIEHGRVYYSAFSLFFQYLLPILIVSAAYFRIYRKLKNRIPVGVAAVNATSQRRVEWGRRMKRTNCLLVSIAVIFGISWMPLNFFNLYADIYLSNHVVVTQTFLIGYAICHMIGMSSACSNPLLYGWLNDNFRKEFKDLLCRGTKSSSVDLNHRPHNERGRPNDGLTEKFGEKKIAILESAVSDNGRTTELTVLVR